MTDDNPSILSHVSLGTRDLDASLAFYDAVLHTLGITRQEEIRLPEAGLVAVAYGKAFPEFWINLPENRAAASVGNGTHVGFTAPDRQGVRRFHAVAIEHGAQDDGAPGPRPHYGAPYYGCFVRDPDGHKIEAMVWEATEGACETNAATG